MKVCNRLKVSEREGGRKRRDQPKKLRAHVHNPGTQTAVGRRPGDRTTGMGRKRGICNTFKNQDNFLIAFKTDLMIQKQSIRSICI